MTDHNQQSDRRKVVKTFLIGGVATAVLLPGSWVRPLVSAVIVPAHATSSAPPTTTVAPTTTAAPTTTPIAW